MIDQGLASLYERLPYLEKRILQLKYLANYGISLEDFCAVIDTSNLANRVTAPLNQCIARTYAKKKELLLALRYPFLPLHNNPAELGARVQARIRDVNLQTVTVNGTETKDTFATISQTARKLGVNIYHYLYDRISKRFEMPPLADLITLKAAQQLNAT